MVGVSFIACEKTPLPSNPPVAKAERPDPFASASAWTVALERPSALPLGPQVVAKAEAIEAETSIKFTVTNASSLPVELRLSSLPWGEENSTSLLAVSDTGEILTFGLPVADPIDLGTVKLLPGQSVAGVKQAKWQIYELAEVLREHNVLVLWVFHPQVIGANPSAPCVGSVIFRRPAPN